MKNYVKDKMIMITGGSSGFGLESARLILEMGGKVAITGRNEEKLNRAVNELENSENLISIKADAGNSSDWKIALEKVMETFGRIDVLVLNHGGGVAIKSTVEMTDDDIRKVLDTNLVSVIKGAREVIPYMKKKCKGHIITVSSSCAHHSWAQWGTYTAAKAGLVGFTKCLHVEMSEWGGKASSFTPGAARTNFMNAADLDDSWQIELPDAADFARTLVHCIDVPDNSFIEEVRIWGVAQVPGKVNPF